MFLIKLGRSDEPKVGIEPIYILRLEVKKTCSTGLQKRMCTCCNEVRVTILIRWKQFWNYTSSFLIKRRFDFLCQLQYLHGSDCIYGSVNYFHEQWIKSHWNYFVPTLFRQLKLPCNTAVIVDCRPFRQAENLIWFETRKMHVFSTAFS